MVSSRLAAAFTLQRMIFEWFEKQGFEKLDDSDPQGCVLVLRRPNAASLGL